MIHGRYLRYIYFVRKVSIQQHAGIAYRQIYIKTFMGIKAESLTFYFTQLQDTYTSTSRSTSSLSTDSPTAGGLRSSHYSSAAVTGLTRLGKMGTCPSAQGRRTPAYQPENFCQYSTKLVSVFSCFDLISFGGVDAPPIN